MLLLFFPSTGVPPVVIVPDEVVDQGSRPSPPLPRLLPPIMGEAASRQGWQTVDAAFYLSLRAYVRIRERSFDTVAIASQCMHAAALSDGLRQKVAGDVRMRMAVSARSAQAAGDMNAILDQVMVLRAISGGEASLAPDYFDDLDLPDTGSSEFALDA